MYCNAEFAPALPAPSVWLVVGLRQPLVLKEGHPTPILLYTALHKVYIHQLSIFCAFMVYAGQRAKNPVSASALLTGKILRVRKIFARVVYNVSLEGSILSRQCKSHPNNMDDFKLFI